MSLMHTLRSVVGGPVRWYMTRRGLVFAALLVLAAILALATEPVVGLLVLIAATAFVIPLELSSLRREMLHKNTVVVTRLDHAETVIGETLSKQGADTAEAIRIARSAKKGFQANRGRVANQRDRFAELRKSQRRLESSVDVPMASMAERLSRLEKSALSADTNADAANLDRLNTLRSDLEQLQREFKLLTDGASPNTPARAGAVTEKSLAPWQSFPRYFEPGEAGRLAHFWARRLQVDLDAKSVEYLASRSRFVESRSYGRAATTITDIVSRAIVGIAVRERDIQVLEIGALFGISSVAMADACMARNRGFKLTVIDPLEGYYDAGSDYTGLPVTSAQLRRNLQLAGLSDDEYVIHPLRSDDPAAKAAVEGQTFDVIVVDGDHSFKGAELDVVNFAPLLADDGFLIVDDYGGDDWPGVVQLGQMLENSNEWVCVGQVSRTGVFQRRLV